jgi:hypothetical protein
MLVFLMPGWTTSLLFALLVVAVPYTSILKIMTQLPKPLALSHRKWSMQLNITLIGLVTSVIAVFIYLAYYRGGQDEIGVAMQFLIAAVAYIFGVALLLRQFAGVYPEFIIITGAFGLTIRKIAYRNIENVEEILSNRGETQMRVRTTRGDAFIFVLPTRYVSIFHKQLRDNAPPL